MPTNQQRLLSPISKIVLLLAFILITPALTTAQVYTELKFDGNAVSRKRS